MLDANTAGRFSVIRGSLLSIDVGSCGEHVSKGAIKFLNIAKKLPIKEREWMGVINCRQSGKE
jgi:hypothetical protein